MISRKPRTGIYPAVFLLFFLAPVFFFSCSQDKIPEKIPEKNFLYCIADSVNIREKPVLSAAKTGSLPIYARVEFLEQTKETTVMSLGGISFTKPWYKIKTPEGITGWVYGGFLYKHLFNQPGKGRSPISLLGWSRNDKLAYLQAHSNWQGIEPIISCEIFDLRTNKKTKIIDFYRIDFPAIAGFVSQKGIKNNYRKDSPEYYNFYYRYSVEYFLFIHRYLINEKLNGLGFVPWHAPALLPLPVQSHGRTIEIKIETKKIPGITAEMPLPGYSQYDVYSIEKTAINKIYSKKQDMASVKTSGYIKNPLTENAIIFIQWVVWNGFGSQDSYQDFIGLTFDENNEKKNP